MIEFAIEKLNETGKIEYTDLTDIDRSVACFFGSMLDSMTIADLDRNENKEFDSFVKKPVYEKLYISQFDDTYSFLEKLAAKTNDDKKRKNLLPCCYISRDPSISYCDGSDYVDMPDYATLVKPTGEPFANVSKSFTKLNYTITSLTWNSSTASRLAVGISMFLRKNKKGRPHTFTAKSMIAGTAVILNVEINQPALVVGSPIGASFSNTRLFGNSFMFEVIAEVLEAKYATVETEHYSFVGVEVIDHE